MLSNCSAEDSWESLGLQGDQTSPSKRESTLNIHWKDWSSNTLSPDAKSWLIGKDPDAGKDWWQEEKGSSEDEMVGWHHWPNGHEFKQTLGDGEEQGSLACCSLWGRQKKAMAEWVNNNNKCSDIIIIESEDWKCWFGIHKLCNEISIHPNLQNSLGEGKDLPNPTEVAVATWCLYSLSLPLSAPIPIREQKRPSLTSSGKRTSSDLVPWPRLKVSSFLPSSWKRPCGAQGSPSRGPEANM